MQVIKYSLKRNELFTFEHINRKITYTVPKTLFNKGMKCLINMNNDRKFYLQIYSP